jgi:hypothetical protein
MANRKSLVLVGGKQYQVPDADALVVGTGIVGVGAGLTISPASGNVIIGGSAKLVPTSGGVQLAGAGAINIGTDDTTATSVNIGTGSDVATVTIGTGPGTGAGTTNIVLDGDVQVNGTEVVIGTTTFQGDTVIGDADTDTLTVTAVVLGDVVLSNAGDHVLYPKTSAAGVGRAVTVQGGTGGAASAGGAASLVGGTGTGSTGGAAYVYGGTGAGGGNGGVVRIRGGAGAASGTVYIGDATTAEVDIGAVGVTVKTSSIVPLADSTYDLGTTGVRWATIYADSIVGAFTPSGDFVPDVDNTYDLGASNKRWAEAHATTVYARADATNTAYSALTAAGIGVVKLTTPYDFTISGNTPTTSGQTGGAVVLQGGAGATVGNGTGGAVSLLAGDAGGSGGVGGSVSIVAGDATDGVGGSFSLEVGAGSTNGSISIGMTTAPDGGLNLGCGIDFKKESDWTIKVSTSTTLNAVGGAITVQGGTGNGTASGGDVVLHGGTGGATDGDGGSIRLRGGAKQGTGTLGSVYVGDSAVYTSDVHLGATSVPISVDGNMTMAAGTTLATTGTGNINLPNNASAKFQIEGTAVGATVTAPNLDELTDGSSTALHTHSGIGAVDTPAVAGETLVYGQPVVYANAAGNPKVYLADANGAGVLADCTGICSIGAAADGATAVRTAGEIAIADIYWDSAPAVGDVGKRAYLSETAGKLTLTAPNNAGSLALRVGFVSKGGAGNVKLVVSVGEGTLN